MTTFMAILVGPAQCKADILHGFSKAPETDGSLRADSMMAREQLFPLTGRMYACNRSVRF